MVLIGLAVSNTYFVSELLYTIYFWNSANFTEWSIHYLYSCFKYI